MTIRHTWIAFLAISITPAFAQTASAVIDGLTQKLAVAHFGIKSPTGSSDQIGPMPPMVWPSWSVRVALA
ncbi:MAG: hypothetical protein AB1704_10180 [Pseudomonadota bacterium]|jgi:hypothetical protein|uniref:hypothetical protein n=1 Tax=Burkholderiaceae TaxID=119060 RepID=UPI0010F86EE2|nr:hypothetical protein [Burkholderia sp. 4M9327F10]